MKRCVAWLLAVVVMFSLAVPQGAVFAAEGVDEFDGLARDSTPTEAAADSVGESERRPEAEPEAVQKVEYEEVNIPAVATFQNGPEATELTIDSQADDTPELAEESELTSPDIVVAQIQVGVQGNASDEYVSIYNQGDTSVDVSGWCLKNKHNRSFACLDASDTQYIIEPGSYIGFSSVPSRPGEHGLVSQFVAGSNFIVASGDTIALMSRDLIIDEVTWSAAPPAGHFAIERDWDVQNPGRLLKGSEGWQWVRSLDIYGYITHYIECGGIFVKENEHCPDPIALNLCEGLIITEVAANTERQFIEVHNNSDSKLSLLGCRLETNRNAKTFAFSDSVLEPREFTVIMIESTDLTLTKSTAGTVSILSSDGLSEIDVVSYSNLAKDTSWSLIDGEWRQTFAPTPSSANLYLRYPPCDEGYWRNEETGRCNKMAETPTLADCGEGRERNPASGRCRNIPTPAQLTPCREGQYRSEETNRCRSIATAAASVLKPCADDQFRNPLTNRCKKIASADEVALADCGEGRERNPATNRCRNVVSASMPVAPFAPEEIKHTAQSTIGWWALGGVSLVAVGYAAWQWRFEMSRLLRRIGSTFVSTPKE